MPVEKKKTAEDAFIGNLTKGGRYTQEQAKQIAQYTNLSIYSSKAPKAEVARREKRMDNMATRWVNKYGEVEANRMLSDAERLAERWEERYKSAKDDLFYVSSSNLSKLKPDEVKNIFAGHLFARAETGVPSRISEGWKVAKPKLAFNRYSVAFGGKSYRVEAAVDLKSMAEPGGWLRRHSAYLLNKALNKGLVKEVIDEKGNRVDPKEFRQRYARAWGTAVKTTSQDIYQTIEIHKMARKYKKTPTKGLRTARR